MLGYYFVHRCLDIILFQEANSFPRASFEEQIMSKDKIKYPSLFLHQMEAIAFIYCPSNVFCNISPIFSKIGEILFSDALGLDQSHMSKILDG